MGVLEARQDLTQMNLTQQSHQRYVTPDQTSTRKKKKHDYIKLFAHFDFATQVTMQVKVPRIKVINRTLTTWVCVDKDYVVRCEEIL